MEFIIHKSEDLKTIAKALLSYACNRKKMAFTGEIGAGKTTFIQAICRHLKVSEYVTSPSFSLINQYSYLDSEGKTRLIYHADMYRLKVAQEAIDIGMEDYLWDDNYCFIEWPGLIEGLLPEDVVRIKLEILEDSSRKIIFL